MADWRFIVGLALGAVVAGAGAIASFDPRVQNVVRKTSNLTMRHTRSLAPTGRRWAVGISKTAGRNGSRSRAATKAI